MSNVNKLEYKQNLSFKHIFCSFLGFFVFFIPIKINLKFYTVFYHIINLLKDNFLDLIKILIIIFLAFGCIKSIYKEKNENSLYKYIRLSTVFLLFSIFYSNKDIFIINSNTSLIIHEISINFFCTILVGSLFLPLLINYGLIQIFDFYLSDFTKKLFKSSGKTILNLLFYFYTDYFLGYFFTNKLYKKGMLKQYEACMIILNFSIAPYFIFEYIYSYVDINILDVIVVFILFLMVNMISCRVYPLNNKKNSYLIKNAYKEPSKKDKDIYDFLKFNDTNFFKEVLDNLEEGINVIISFLPDIIFCIYVSSIFINNTNIIQNISTIIYPVFDFLKIQEISQIIEFIFINFFNSILAIDTIDLSYVNFLCIIIFVISSISISTNIIYINKTKIPINNFEFVFSYFFKSILLIFMYSFIYYFFKGYIFS